VQGDHRDPGQTARPTCCTGPGRAPARCAERAQIVQALGEIGDVSAEPALVERLKTDEYVPVRVAGPALVRMGGARAVMALKWSASHEKEPRVPRACVLAWWNCGRTVAAAEGMRPCIRRIVCLTVGRRSGVIGGQGRARLPPKQGNWNMKLRPAPPDTNLVERGDILDAVGISRCCAASPSRLSSATARALSGRHPHAARCWPNAWSRCWPQVAKAGRFWAPSTSRLS